jgi:hypothetical protein
LSPIARPRGGLAASDLLSRVRAEIDARCNELRPALAEYERLLSAAEAIGLDLDGAPAPARAPRPPARKAAARKASARKPAAAKEPALKVSARRTSGGKPSSPVAVTEAPVETPPAAAARVRARGKRGSAAGAIVRASSSPARGGRAAAGKAASKAGAQRDTAQRAIVAALEHGSHTVAELGVVTAMSGASIREGLRRLTKAGAVRRAKREGDGKAAYALSATVGA